MDDSKEKRDFSDLTIDYQSKRKYAPPRERDTETALLDDEVSDVGVSGFRIPPAGRDTPSSGAPRGRQVRTLDYRGGGAVFNRNSRPASRDKGKGEVKENVIRRYQTGGRYITDVTVSTWPGSRGFYEKFVSDAMISHARHGEAAPHVQYFSYIPQYSQLTPSMWRFYLWFKESVRRGERLPDADFSYVILYVYEIINLEGVISPAEGAELLARIWVMYRPMHPALDKYLSEWMADYCLVHEVPLPKILTRILSEVGAKARLKEFYADGVISAGLSIGPLIRLALSDHNLTKGRYVRDIEGFADEVCAVFDAVIAEHMSKGIGLFEPRLNRTSELTIDAFCGSLCASTVKKKIHLKLMSFFRLPEARRIVTELIKGCENIVRARHGIKARLSAHPVTGTSYVITARSAEEVAYMSYYDSPEVELTPEKAAEIEADSWQNVAALTFDEASDMTEEHFDEPEGAFFSDGAELDLDRVEATSSDGGDSMDFTAEETPRSTMTASAEVGGEDEKLKGALWAAAEGGSFTAACREAGLFADVAAAKINEAALDFIGDVVLEQRGTDYVFIEDYIDDIGLLF
ncbi:MAG: TerB N-terminal domain-containing protein [Clostridia bacterium]|nr:TerB N-terminal domain-containing protein [Clostridia bacterium]